jgi:hypothetical protein
VIVFDINGQPLRQGRDALLLCEILDITERGVHLRVRNSTEEMLVSITHDEVLGGLVAGSELTAFLETENESKPDPRADEVSSAPHFE